MDSTCRLAYTTPPATKTCRTPPCCQQAEQHRTPLQGSVASPSPAPAPARPRRSARAEPSRRWRRPGRHAHPHHADESDGIRSRSRRRTRSAAPGEDAGRRDQQTAGGAGDVVTRSGEQLGDILLIGYASVKNSRRRTTVRSQADLRGRAQDASAIEFDRYFCARHHEQAAHAPRARAAWSRAPAEVGAAVNQPSAPPPSAPGERSLLAAATW